MLKILEFYEKISHLEIVFSIFHKHLKSIKNLHIQKFNFVLLKVKVRERQLNIHGHVIVQNLELFRKMTKLNLGVKDERAHNFV